MKRRIGSVLMAVTMVIAFTLGNFSAVFADTQSNTTSTKGVYWFDPHEVGMDLTDTFVYDDALLTGDSLPYNQQLATMSFELAVASISSEREAKTPEGYANKSRNLRAYLEDNGFIDFDTNQYYKEGMTVDTFGVACAHKTIIDNGTPYTLLAIVPRSAGYEAEWGGNFEMGESGDHAGFKKAREIVLDFARQYISNYGISGDIKVWTAGYSRGAGVTNQVGAALIADPGAALGGSVTLAPSNLYCYTYGTPRSAGIPNADFGDPADPKFDYIHNTWESYDLVTAVPPEALGFTRYGKNFTYADRGDKDRMLSMLQQTNETMYNLYQNGGDPDGFTPKTVDLEQLILNRRIVLVDDPESYLPYNQRDFMGMMESSIMAAVGDRATYYSKFEPAMKDLAGYFFSHLNQGSALIGAIKDSKYTVPMLAFMYISYMLERYNGKSLDDSTKQEILDAISLLEQTILEIESGGEIVPEELKSNLEKLKSALKDAGTWGILTEIAQTIAAWLYQQVIREGLLAAGLPDEDWDLYRRITSIDQCKAITRLATYILLYDDRQTDDIISFDMITQQMKHLATFIGNASSYMKPHYNEIITSWLKTLDSNYDDYAKENTAQISGYRRLYIEAPEGVIVSGTVKDDAGNVVATFENGKILSRTDAWIGITTCDTGNWLRLPVDKTYKIDLAVSEDTTLNLKATEYNVYDNTEVRVETSDENYNWQGLAVKANDRLTWTISAVEGPEYTLASDAHYYIEFLYTITYDLNGGELDGETGTISQDYLSGTVIELPAPTRDGYTFDYWEGSRYEAGEQYTVTKDHTFIAKWIKNESPDDGDKEDKEDKKDQDDQGDQGDQGNKDNQGDQGTERATSVKTGDESNSLLWIIICCLSVLLLINLALYRFKIRNR